MLLLHLSFRALLMTDQMMPQRLYLEKKQISTWRVVKLQKSQRSEDVVHVGKHLRHACKSGAKAGRMVLLRNSFCPKKGRSVAAHCATCALTVQKAPAAMANMQYEAWKPPDLIALVSFLLKTFPCHLLFRPARL